MSEQVEIYHESPLDGLNRTLRVAEMIPYLFAGEIREDPDFPKIVGASKVMKDIAVRVRQAATRSHQPILFLGETGTGKNLFAKAVHALTRASGSFVQANCAAIPDTLFEAELFGHSRGAFTDANRMRPGKIRHARNGTIFLDEIAELSITAQAKLLEVLEGTYSPVGSDETIDVKTRFVLATNCNVEDAVRQKKIRADLFYRISALTITIPPLREHREDIPHLVEYFLQRHPETRIPRGAMQLLDPRRVWPGNIRELQNAVESLRVFGSVPIARHSPELILPSWGDGLKSGLEEHLEYTYKDMKKKLREIEAEYILKLLRKRHGNVSQSARQMDVSRKTLNNRISQLGISLKEITEMRNE